jgi:hypothetical protein
MNLIDASTWSRRRPAPALALVREPDGRPCPGCRGETATVWTEAGEVRVALPEGRLPALVEARPHRCASSHPDECPGHDRGGTAPPCCERAGQYNGFGSDGPLLFWCPASCRCHD